jgi:hypothetical protein
MAALIGVAVAVGRVSAVLTIILAALALSIALASWRWSIYLLMAYMPFAGIASLVAYPDTAGAALIKDVMFAAPAYVGFVVAFARHREEIQLGRLPLRWLSVFAVIVAIQVLHTWLSGNLLVGLIGLKIYLFYIPTYVLGFHLITDDRSLKRVLSLLCLVAVPPTLIGLTEALLLYKGHADVVYSAYGAAAFAATQGFAAYQFSSGVPLVRVPSTFAFVTQYFFFETTMIAIGYAWWRWLDISRSRWRSVGPVVWALFGMAAVSSGQKSVFLLVPLLVALIVAFDLSIRRASLVLALSAGSIIAMTQLLGINVGDALAGSTQIGVSEFQNYFVGYSQQILATGWAGAGVGVFTSLAGRYAEVGDVVYYEAWIVKVLAEVGVAGLITIAVIVLVILVRGLRAHLRLSDGPWRSTSAALIALLVWTVFYSTKAAPLDIDPLSVYFWLFAGIQARVATIGSSDATLGQLPRGTQGARIHKPAA